MSGRPGTGNFDDVEDASRSAPSVRQPSSAEDLAKVEGVSEALAQRIFDYFRKS